MGVYGEILYPLLDLNEIWHHRVHPNPSNDRGEFEFDRARSKNNIAENSFALEHETDNKYEEKGQSVLSYFPGFRLQREVDSCWRKMENLNGNGSGLRPMSRLRSLSAFR